MVVVGIQILKTAPALRPYGQQVDMPAETECFRLETLANSGVGMAAPSWLGVRDSEGVK